MPGRKALSSGPPIGKDEVETELRNLDANGSGDPVLCSIFTKSGDPVAAVPVHASACGSFEKLWGDAYNVEPTKITEAKASAPKKKTARKKTTGAAKGESTPHKASAPKTVRPKKK